METEETIPCEYCGEQIPVSRYPGHSLLCTLSTIGVANRFGGSATFGSSLLSFLSGRDTESDYESNLRLQEEMGGPVKKACKDINLAAPVVNDHSIDKCVVCLSEIDSNSRVRRGAKCSHEFCAECLEKWLSEHTTCPMCITDLSENGGSRYVIDESPVTTSQERSAGIARDDSSVLDFSDLPPLVPSDDPVSLYRYRRTYYVPSWTSMSFGSSMSRGLSPSMRPSPSWSRAPRTPDLIPTNSVLQSVRTPTPTPVVTTRGSNPEYLVPYFLPGSSTSENIRNTRDLMFHMSQVRDIIENARDDSQTHHDNTDVV